MIVKIRNQIITMLLAVLFAFVCFGCSSETNTVRPREYEKKSEILMYTDSSNGDLNLFMNDFFRRNMRYDEQSLAGWGEDVTLGAVTGAGSWFGKEWEALALSYFDSSAETYGTDRYETVCNWLRGQPIDKFGYVWNGADRFEAGRNTEQLFKQGWPFPDYTWNTGSLPGWEFNSDGDAEGWTDNGESSFVSNGFYSVSAVDADSLEFVWPKDKVVLSALTPFAEFDIALLDTATFGQTEMAVGDVQIKFKNDASDEWHTAAMRDYCTRPVESISPNFRQNMYFDMYNHPQWANKNITDVKLVILPKKGKKLNVDAKLNFFRLQFDSRQVNNNSILITATKAMYEYSHDVEFLKKMLPKVKRAVQFYLTNLGGETGVISNAFCVGHEIRLDEYGSRIMGYGIGDGYWDMLSLPEKNIYINVYFYKAIRDAAWLLKAAEHEQITCEEQTIVTNEGLQVKCGATADKLEALMSIAETQFTQTFWNERTQRFHAGYSNAYGTIIDYGFVYFNLEAIVAGLASPAQVTAIYDWLDGKRIVQSQTYDCAGGGTLDVVEKSTGEDIYLYRFAPRANTADNDSGHYLWTWTPRKFGNQLQNGGAALFMSYYDLVARAKYLGIENAAARLDEIRKWYSEVLAFNETDESARGGAYFYWDYYQALDLDENPWIMTAGNLLEGSNMGTAGAGLLALDYVFPETAIFWRALPEMYFGLNVTPDNVLNITPNLSNGLTWYANENLKYSGLLYDLKVGANFVQINCVRGKVQNEKVRVTLKKPTGNFTVYMNGRALGADEYAVSGDKIIITVKFCACKIEIR
ncbi:hypothetical protein [Pumilibacter intestinalis]|uniref:hypothetical protein n=1 Tax=Pumilibacter intestinalis TaxID=2941511 RepID=UPI00203F4624|nr:hypothetical protein [Pumilibacter intestinalis]